MQYRQYLQSDHWKDVKHRYDNSRYSKICEACHLPNKQLNLHHRTYKSIGHERLQHLVYLCQNCHYKLHQYVKKNKLHLWGGTKQFIKKIGGTNGSRTDYLRKQYWDHGLKAPLSEYVPAKLRRMGKRLHLKVS